MIGVTIPAAAISPDGIYRYFLSRRLAPNGTVIAFIGLNPSTADATEDDPTIRRCMSFARSWGARELWMSNLFAYRSKDPSKLATAGDPIGRDNDGWLDEVVTRADMIIAAWGNWGALLGRGEAVRERYRGKLHALRITGRGMPGHPLYIDGATRPTTF